MKKEQSITAKNGQFRIKYDPDWNPSLPFCTYKNGTAGPCFASLAAAANYFSSQDNQVIHKWTEFK